MSAIRKFKHAALVQRYLRIIVDALERGTSKGK